MSVMFYFRTRSQLWALVLLLLTCSVPLLAQQSTIQGLVRDSSGAAVPGASVTVTNTSTGVSQIVISNDHGFYAVPFLIPGTYSVKAMMGGFAAQTVSDITLDVSTTARADFVLAIGKVETTIKVSASAALLNTETTAVGQVIDNQRVVELPLNGRNYLELARLTTGVGLAPGSKAGDQGSFTSVGSHAMQITVLLDGLDNTSRYTGGQFLYETQAVMPSIDAVQEFKVVTNNNSAEYGFRTGGTVVVQTKTGTNDYRGTLYEFLRNDKFAANNFFANAAGQEKTVYKRNQFGATLGGKIIRDKTFFFGSYEGRRVRIGRSTLSTVPLVSRVNGDFSDSKAMQIFDPASTQTVSGKPARTPFPGNIVPKNRFDPIAAKVISWYPAPNLPGVANNYFFSPPSAQSADQYDGRLDHNFTSSQRVFFRYSRRNYTEVDPGPLPLPADGGANIIDLLANSYVANWSALLSPKMSNEFRFGYNATNAVIDIPSTGYTNRALGIPNIPDLGYNTDHGVCNFSPTNYAAVGSDSSKPNKGHSRVLQISDSLTRIQGRHFLKFGFQFIHAAVSRNVGKYSRGTMAFNGSFTQDPNSRATTGDGLADMLLGLGSSARLGNYAGEESLVRRYGVFIQDDLKLSPKLTLNLGLRWDRIGIPSFGHRSTFNVGLFILGAPGTSDIQIIRPKNDNDCGCEHDTKNFAPRIGVAYQLGRSTVLRSGFGMFYGQPDEDKDTSIFWHGPPDNSQFSFTSDRLVQPAVVISRGYPAGLFPATTVQQNVNINTALSRFVPTQYAMQWFLDVQRQLPFDTLLTLSYIGTGSRQLLFGPDLNVQGNQGPGPATALQRKTWPFFGSISVNLPGGNISYNGLAAKVEKRFSRGITFLTSYTFSHMIDDGAGANGDNAGSSRNPWNAAMDRGNGNYDRRQNFVGSLIYDLPFGKARQWGAAWNPVVNTILGGWQLGGILSLRTGQPFSVTVSGDPANTGNTNYANRLGTGTLSASQRSINRWFDLTAFAVPAQYTYGNGGRNILFGPGVTNMDLKIGKNFRLAERYRLEFRAEMFNFTNTPNFGQPNAVLNGPGAGIIKTAAAPRIVQFGLKLMF